MLQRDVLRRRACILDFASNVVLFLGAAVVVGMAAGDIGSSVSPLDVLMYQFLNMLAGASALKTFSDNKLIFWREMSCGYSKLAFFFSQNLLDFPQTTAYVISFWAIYIELTTPLADAGTIIVLIDHLPSSGVSPGTRITKAHLAGLILMVMWMMAFSSVLHCTQSYCIILYHNCLVLNHTHLYSYVLNRTAFHQVGMAYAFAVFLVPARQSHFDHLMNDDQYGAQENPMLPMLATNLILNVILSGYFSGMELSEDMALPYFLSPTRWGAEMICVSSYNKWPAASSPSTAIASAGWSESTTGDGHWTYWYCLITQGGDTCSLSRS